MVKSKQYAAALENYIWFHEHALDSDTALTGVRLSYALNEWVELGMVYPPALRALEATRNRKAERLMDGSLDASLFHDVASINEALGQTEQTRDLFKVIAVSDRRFAESCFRSALRCLVELKEYGLARSFLPEPQRAVDRFAAIFKGDMGDMSSADLEMLEKDFAQIYADKVSLILQLLVALDEEEEANKVLNYALNAVPSANLRVKVMERLRPYPSSS